jgi:hypothetical protein
VRTYQEVFADVFVFEVPNVSNRIVVAVPKASGVEKRGLARRASELSTTHKFGFDLGELATSGFRHRTEKDRGRVLLDRDAPSK